MLADHLTPRRRPRSLRLRTWASSLARLCRAPAGRYAFDASRTVSGPVQLSYPSNTYKELQTASTLGRMGPVPQNAWVAMVPLIVATLLSVMMLAFLWGRRYVLLHSTKLAAFLLNGKVRERLCTGRSLQVL